MCLPVFNCFFLARVEIGLLILRPSNLGLFRFRRKCKSGSRTICEFVQISAILDTMLIVSSTKHNTCFSEPKVGHFRLFILRPSNLGLFRFPFPHVAPRKRKNPEFGAVQMNANFEDLEKCCKMSIWTLS